MGLRGGRVLRTHSVPYRLGVSAGPAFSYSMTSVGSTRQSDAYLGRPAEATRERCSLHAPGEGAAEDSGLSSTLIRRWVRFPPPPQKSRSVSGVLATQIPGSSGIARCGLARREPLSMHYALLCREAVRQPRSAPRKSSTSRWSEVLVLPRPGSRRSGCERCGSRAIEGRACLKSTGCRGCTP